MTDAVEELPPETTAPSQGSGQALPPYRPTAS
jgi:hypothetical protein